MKTHVEFRADKFPPDDGEEGQTNPDLWGKRLGAYLQKKLRAEGIETGELTQEDWGWRLPVTNSPFPMWIGCGHYQEYPNGYLCFIEPSKPLIRKLFKKIDTTERVSRVAEALDRILTADPDIMAIRWWQEDER